MIPRANNNRGKCEIMSSCVFSRAQVKSEPQLVLSKAASRPREIRQQRRGARGANKNQGPRPGVEKHIDYAKWRMLKERKLRRQKSTPTRKYRMLKDMLIKAGKKEKAVWKKGINSTLKSSATAQEKIKHRNRKIRLSRRTHLSPIGHNHIAIDNNRRTDIEILLA